MHSDDDSVFNDDLNDSEITNLIQNIPSSSGSSSSGRNKLQRNLYGEIIPQEYVEVESTACQKQFPPTHHDIDYGNLASYIYPTNFEVRDYQFNIVQRAFYDNLLVALPTGLGKTFIASTVMLNFTRWFPRARIIFMAPTKPLVAQQIKACCGITGIHSSQVAILLDKTRRNRADIWDSKTVFFTTPQVVENDLATGIVDPKSVALLVIDEAHKSKGNYAYNNVVKFLSRFNSSFRVLALTATPASDVEGVQEIIDNLSISKVEVRTERSIDISKYMKRKIIERVTVTPSPEMNEFTDMLCTAIKPILSMANDRKIYDMTDPSKINAFQVIDASQRLLKNQSIPDGLRWQNYFILQILNVVGQAFRRLNIYGIRSFYSYFDQKHKEFVTKFNNKKSNNQNAAKFYFHENINLILDSCKSLISDKDFLGHPKLEVLINELHDFFEEHKADDSRVIIFTEFRESALDIVNSIEKLDGNLKPHIFIGQSKEKEKFDEEKYLTKGKKGKAKGKAKGKEKDKDELERSTSRTSSEDAQIKGMNQKVQKDIIKKFKKGEYNILVATSIGEEGLDIGEVDLIVCYDSTSSPIKNIQRMGRTGRKREGKVLLLFAGNEESKFDKAMGGYEYIQQHIMNNRLITLSQSNRIIPKGYQPIVEKKFIEIPEENFEINEEEDEDEIIRIATMYMNNKSRKVSKSKSKLKPKKIEKRFFMPDNVETGFRNVTTMIRKADDDKSLAAIRNGKNLLDSILDSDSENVFSESDDNPVGNDNSNNINDSNRMNSPATGRTHPSHPKTSSEKDNTLEIRTVTPEIEHNIPQVGVAADKGSADTYINNRTYVSVNSPTIQSDDTGKENFIQNLVATSIKTVNKPKTLGLKRRKTDMNITDQLKQQYNKVIKPATSNQTITVDDDIETEPPICSGTENKYSPRNTHDRAEEPLDDDVFDDGLDDELLSISKDKLSSFERSASPNPISNHDKRDVIFKHDFGPHEGLLSQDELFELYTSYYSTLDPVDQMDFYDPSSKIFQKNSRPMAHGKIGHSKRSQRLLDSSKFMLSTTSDGAKEIIDAHKHKSKQNHYDDHFTNTNYK